MNEQSMIGTAKFARLVGVSEDTVRRLELRGIITAVRDSGNRRQFSADQVARALKHYSKDVAA
jgi:excisionase family DNA binding protein